jgi:uncharacterized protein (DUF983 family)
VSEDNEYLTEPVRAKRPFSEAVSAGLRGRCPNCMRGPVFRSWFKVRDDCPVCHLTYWPESGYYLGAMFLDYILSFMLVTPVYVLSLWLELGTGYQSPWKPVVMWVCGGALVSLGLMRYAYGLWLALDFWLSPWEVGKPPELLPR